MSNVYRRTVETPGQHHNYLLGGNITNSFALGDIGSDDDFFLIGFEPNEESHYSLISGNLLDREGRLLCQLRNNEITVNPGHCYLDEDLISYEISDSEGNLLLSVSTEVKKLDELDEECFVTTMAGNFYNKEGDLVVIANLGEEGEVVTSSNSIFGYRNGNFGNFSWDESELEFLRIIFAQRRVLQFITGVHENESLEINGKCLINTTFRNCQLSLSGGNFLALGYINLEFNTLIPSPQVAAIFQIYEVFKQNRLV